MSIRFALASSSGITIDEHFGEASTFYIYDKGEKTVDFREKRVCRCSNEHSQESFDRKIEVITDCKALFVFRIGQYAAQHVLEKGIRVFEAPYPVDTVLRQIELGKIEFDSEKKVEEKNDSGNK